MYTYDKLEFLVKIFKLLKLCTFTSLKLVAFFLPFKKKQIKEFWVLTMTSKQFPCNSNSAYRRQREILIENIGFFAHLLLIQRNCNLRYVGHRKRLCFAASKI